MNKKIVAVSLSLVLGVAVASSASARPIRIDFGDNFVQTGADWTGSSDDAVDVLNDGTSGGVLPFNLLIGGTSYSTFCFSENAVISFQASGDACAADPTSGAIFSVADADWVSTFGGTSSTDDGAVSVSLDGFVDREPDLSITPDFDADPPISQYDPAQGQDTFRFYWNRVTLAGGDPFETYEFQALFFRTSDTGDFDVEFNFGQDSAQLFPGQQFISAGGQTLYTGTAPFTSATDYFFSFVGGQLDGGTTPPPPTPVPEPDTLWLMLAGLGVLGALLAHRRKSGLAAATLA